jgi:oligopeptide transport system substrate-binding protein
LELELENPASYFIHLLTNFYPVPKHVVEKNGDEWTCVENIVTNGPYMLETQQKGRAIVLVRNPKYHGHFPGNIQRVEAVLSNKTPTELQEMYEANELDAVRLANIPQNLLQIHGEEYFNEPIPSCRVIAFNPNNSPFDNVNVRRACIMALNRERLSDEILQGMRDPGTGGIIPPVIPGHSSGIGIPYDPDQALKLLEDAGYPNGEGFPEIKLVWHRKTDEIKFLQEQWQSNLNVNVNFEAVKFQNIYEWIYMNDVRYSGVVASYNDPDNALAFQRVMVPEWHNEEFKTLLEKARRSMSQEERIRVLKDADKILIEAAVLAPLTYERAHVLAKPWLKIPLDGYVSWNLKDFIIEPH